MTCTRRTWVYAWSAGLYRGAHQEDGGMGALLGIPLSERESRLDDDIGSKNVQNPMAREDSDGSDEDLD